MPAARISSGACLREREHDVDIVNHQIEHHVHVQAARAEFAQPVHLEEQGLGDHRLERRYGRIEALQMPDLQNAPGARRGLDQHAGFVDGVRRSASRSAHPHPAPSAGGRFRHGCAWASPPRPRRPCRPVPPATPVPDSFVGTGSLGRALRVGVQNSGQFGMFRLMNHAQMVAAEAAGSDHGDTGF